MDQPFISSKAKVFQNPSLKLRLLVAQKHCQRLQYKINIVANKHFLGKHKNNFNCGQYAVEFGFQILNDFLNLHTKWSSLQHL